MQSPVGLLLGGAAVSLPCGAAGVSPVTGVVPGAGCAVGGVVGAGVDCVVEGVELGGSDCGVDWAATIVAVINAKVANNHAA